MIFAVAVCLAWSPVPVVAGWCSPDFRVRESVSAVRFGPGPWGWAETLPHPEVRLRSERARRAVLNIALRRLGPYPCADACWYDTTAKAYRPDSAISGWDRLGLLRRLEAVGGSDSYPHRNYREATRQWVSDRLWDGTPESDLAKLLEEMRRRDRVWYKTMGSPVPWEK